MGLCQNKTENCYCVYRNIVFTLNLNLMMYFLQFMFIFQYIYIYTHTHTYRKLGFQCTTHSVNALFCQQIWKKNNTYMSKNMTPLRTIKLYQVKCRYIMSCVARILHFKSICSSLPPLSLLFSTSSLINRVLLWSW